MMEQLTSIAAVAVTAVLMAGVLRRGTPELASVLLLAAGVWILISAAEILEDVVNMLARLSRLAGLDGAVVEPVMKTVALSILTRVTAEMCRSSGEGGIASFVEVAGTVLALGAAIPLCDAVVRMVTELMV